MAQNCPFEVTPLAQSKIRDIVPFRNLDYTNQEYWSMKNRVLEIIGKNFRQDFTDLTESSLFIVLLECYLFIADTLSFKIDQIANELFIDTVTEEANIFRLAKLLGFKPSPPMAARASFVASISAPLDKDILINTPIGLQLDDSVGRRFYELFAADSREQPTKEPIVIPAGKLFTKQIIGIEGRTLRTQFESSGAAHQVFEIPAKSVYTGSVEVSVDDILWDAVDNFNTFEPQPEFRVEYNSHYRPYLIFGNNRGGLIPPKGSTIKVKYRSGVGGAGNVITGAFNEKVFAYVPGMSSRVTVFVKNYTKGEFGYDGDTLEDIRRKLPFYSRLQNRAVNDLDYKLLAEKFETPTNGNIGKATAVLRNSGCAGNVVDIYVLAREGDDDLDKASDNLKEDLYSFMKTKKMFTDHICIKDGDVVYVDIHVDLILDRFYQRVEKDLREKVNRRIENFFLVAGWDYGQSLFESDVIKLISDLPEISSVRVNFTSPNVIEEGNHSIIEAKYHEVIRPDNIFVSFNYKNE